jgi:hypothetical protein
MNQNKVAPAEHRLGRNRRRVFVQLCYEEMGCPPKFHEDGQECWNGKGGVIEAMLACLPFSMDKRTAVWVCEETFLAFKEKRLDSFDAGAMELGGSKYKGTLSDDGISLALRFARDDGLDCALMMVNDLRKAKREGYNDVPPDPPKTGVSWSGVQRAAKAWGAMYHRRQRRKTGSRDKTSYWAVFRFLFAKKLSEQFSDMANEDRTAGWKKLSLYQVLFMDEHHDKIQLGKANANPYEWICTLDKDENKWPAKSPRETFGLPGKAPG